MVTWREQRRGRRATGTLLAAVLLTGVVVVGPAAPASARGCPRGHVALTFDDGPNPRSTTALLRVLKRKRVRATFFMTGRAVQRYPARARLVSRRGHRIYNHTWSHPHLTRLSNTRIRRQITKARRAFDRAGLRHGPVLRPPFGDVDARVRRVARSTGHRTVLWTWDPRDWASGRTATQIVRSTMRGLRPGANILLHDHERKSTVRALPRIIRGARARGYCLGVVNRRGRVVPAIRRR
jgi:peptidoglycan/xylan/chitin deacetylase (PgdA/CDA1 family)